MVFGTVLFVSKLWRSNSFSFVAWGIAVRVAALTHIYSLTFCHQENATTKMSFMDKLKKASKVSVMKQAGKAWKPFVANVLVVLVD